MSEQTGRLTVGGSITLFLNYNNRGTVLSSCQNNEVTTKVLYDFRAEKYEHLLNMSSVCADTAS